MAEAEKETVRLEAFSDGVFAFAMTLLVLNLGVDIDFSKDSPRELLGALWGLHTELAALVLTFGTVYVLWMSHHALFRRVHHIDGLVLFANGFFLLLISASAIPTRILSSTMNEAGARVGAGVYATYFLLVNVAFYLLGQAIARSQSHGAHAHTDLQLRQVRRRTSFGFVLYLTAALGAFFSEWVTIAICGLLWAFWAWVAFTRHRHTHVEFETEATAA